MSITYKIFSKQNIIVEKYIGSVKWLDAIKLKKKVISDPLYDNTYKVLIDGRHAELEINRKGMLDYVITIIDTMPYATVRRTAILADSNSHEFNFKMLIEMMEKMSIDVSYTTTIPMAFKWINLNESDYPEIVQYLNNKE